MSPVFAAACFITVYGGTSDWKQRLSYSGSHEDDAYLIVLDTQGVMRWLNHGAFDPDDLHRRREP